MDEELEGTQDARIESLWNSLDTQGDGQLDVQGLKSGLRKIDHPLRNADDLLDQVIKAVDNNGDGRIQYQEFSKFVAQAEDKLWQLFKKIDADHNNQISKSELREAFTKAGIDVSSSKLDDFFAQVDADHDGIISFHEWRDFLLFLPAQAPGLRSVLTYFTSTVKLNAEGDVTVSDEMIEGAGTFSRFISSAFGIFQIIQTPEIRHRPPDSLLTAPITSVEGKDAERIRLTEDEDAEIALLAYHETVLDNDKATMKPLLTALGFNPGYFLAGGIAGIVSRTSTAPLDRLKVYLIAQTSGTSKAVEAAKQGSAVQATKHAARPLRDACVALWKAGGMRSLFAGNGLNVAKVMPESAIKFGSYEASKRFVAQLEGHGDPKNISAWSQFVAGGMGGMISQFCVYPIDTLKFRMQCETVQGGQRGNALIATTAKKMWAQSGLRTYYRGLSMGLVGMFPYSAIDLGTFEFLKKRVTARNARIRGCSEDEATPGSVATAFIGGFSGALGATLVYPLNLLRTRLQTQGTATHNRTYTGIVDVTRQTIQGEGVRGLFKGLTPNLLKVVPAVSITYVVYEKSKQVLKLY